MFNFRFFIFSFLVLALTSTNICFAQNEKLNASEQTGSASKSAVAVNDLSTAAALADYGKRENNPVALVVAAQIIKSTPTQKDNKSKETKETPQDAAKSASTYESVSAIDADQLLVEAKSMTQDPAILEMIDKIAAAEGSRGRKEGPVEHEDVVLARKTDVYIVTMKAKEKATVAVVSDGKNDLDLFIYDENGNLIEKDDDETPHCIVEWTPRWEGKFRIEIKNNGSSSSKYLLLTN